jgi:hypothetical protein
MSHWLLKLAGPLIQVCIGTQLSESLGLHDHLSWQQNNSLLIQKKL